MNRFRVFLKLRNGQNHYYVGNQKDVLYEMKNTLNKWVRVERIGK